jgi:NADPH-dependent 2,4-dienoyl-CoA reductase/sulfur reductase-like enzyme
MIGYEPRLPHNPDGPPPQPKQPPRTFGASGILDYDAIVIGAGAGGGVMACLLAEAGRSVLLLERGRAGLPP